MIKKNVTYSEYRILKAIYADIKVLTANDESATVAVSKWQEDEEAMAMTYFNNVCTLEELRKQYKELLKIHHPDNGGNVAQMQEVNASTTHCSSSWRTVTTATRQTATKQVMTIWSMTSRKTQSCARC